MKIWPTIFTTSRMKILTKFLIALCVNLLASNILDRFVHTMPCLRGPRQQLLQESTMASTSGCLVVFALVTTINNWWCQELVYNELSMSAKQIGKLHLSWLDAWSSMDYYYPPPNYWQDTNTGVYGTDNSKFPYVRTVLTHPERNMWLCKCSQSILLFKDWQSFVCCFNVALFPNFWNKLSISTKVYTKQWLIW